jgi:hypothetical protein
LTKKHQIALQDLDVSFVRHHVDLKEHQFELLKLNVVFLL